MTAETILTNALLVLPEEVLPGTLVVREDASRRCSPAAAMRPAPSTWMATT
ncbi:hypothetical protein ACFQU7_06030 [Pseudoroseomonas wenyumeiae]